MRISDWSSDVCSSDLEHGVAVAHALEGVGENRQDHLQMRMIFKVENALTLNQRAGKLLGKLGMGCEYLLFRRGPLSMAPCQLGAFTRSDPSRETPNLQYHVQPLSLEDRKSTRLNSSH